MEFTADQLHAGVHTPHLQQLAVSRVAGQLLNELSEFDGNPTILPLPPEVPPEVPRIVLTDAGDTMRLQVAVSRSDLFLRREATSLDVEAFFDSAPRTLEVVLTSLDMRPGRLAATATFFHRCDDPASYLAQHFCRSDRIADDGPLASLRTFELHAHRRFELEGLAVNTWVRCKVGSVMDGGAAARAIIVERDLNTIPEETESRQFDADAVRNFMREAGSQITTEITRFFPESD